MVEQGVALLQGGRFHEAVAAFQQALRQQPASVPLRIALARACIGTGDLVTATAWLSDAVRIAPGDREAVQLLADLLLAQKHYGQALPLYLQLLERHGERTAANLLHGGFCHEHLGGIDAAAALYAESIAADPSLVEPEVDLAGVLWRLEDFEGSLAHARRAVDLAPEHPYAQRILGTALLNLNRLEDAEHHLRRALQLKPEFALAGLDLAFALLLAGRLDEGWRRYESRWRDPDRLPRPSFYRPEAEWPGPSVPLQGQAIAVYAEQGLGDVIQCLRYLPMLQGLGAHVRCVLQPELVGLVEASFPGVQCLVPGRDLTVQWHIAMMELPARFGTTLQAIPAPARYLQVSVAAQEAWRSRLAPWEGRKKIGIAWSGSLSQVNNRNRAIPLSTLQPLLDLPGTQCFSLQKGAAPAYTDVALDHLADLTPQWNDFVDSAAMVDALDLVITVDTSIAHLAGALGKPVWVLLPPNADWRWLLERDDSPWYPSMRLFRRGFGEPREAQVDRVREALRAWLA